jgi:predicted GNAT family N-acyltransferase
VSAQEFDVQPLHATHNRAAFDCGVESLTEYLRTTAGQDLKRRAAVPYILVPLDEPTRVVGYYTLTSASIALSDFPPDVSKKLAKYPNVPATLLGRLAVNTADKGQRHGERLLLDALSRSLSVSAHVGSAAVLVDAIDASAAAFYQRYGFTPFPDTPLRLFFPLKDVKTSLTK